MVMKVAVVKQRTGETNRFCGRWIIQEQSSNVITNLAKFTVRWQWNAEHVVMGSYWKKRRNQSDIVLHVNKLTKYIQLCYRRYKRLITWLLKLHMRNRQRMIQVLDTDLLIKQFFTNAPKQMRKCHGCNTKLLRRSSNTQRSSGYG